MPRRTKKKKGCYICGAKRNKTSAPVKHKGKEVSFICESHLLSEIIKAGLMIDFIPNEKTA